MMVRGKLHVPAALSLGQEPSVNNEEKALWATEPFWTFRIKKDLLPIPGFDSYVSNIV
jgi:hypothetical protein